MDRDDLLIGLGVAATALSAAEIFLQMQDRAESKTKFHRERKTMERPWERFDPYSGWEPLPGFVSSDVIINSHGFRGQDMSRGKVARIMCLGDGTTFGPPGEKNTYPHALQTTLARRRTSRLVEVVNAGVSGHSTCNMLFRLPQLLRFRPGIVIVFAGWNDLNNEAPGCYRDNRRRFSSYWHYLDGKNIYCHLAAKLRESAGLKNRKPLPVSYSLDEFVPFNFEYNLRKIIGGIRRKSAHPVLLTLPKLIPGSLSRLSAAVKSRANLPDFIEDGDLKGFLKLYRAYDAIIRQVAEETGCTLFDAARYFERLKEPRGSLFEDTRHLTAEGSKALGKFVANSLIEKELVT